MAKQTVNKNEAKKKYPRQFEVGTIRLTEYNGRDVVKVVLNKGVEIAINGEVVPLQQAEDGKSFPIVLFGMEDEAVRRGEAKLVEMGAKEADSVQRQQEYREKVGVTHVLKVNVPDDFGKTES